VGIGKVAGQYADDCPKPNLRFSAWAAILFYQCVEFEQTRWLAFMAYFQDASQPRDCVMPRIIRSQRLVIAEGGTQFRYKVTTSTTIRKATCRQDATTSDKPQSYLTW
jgi:hypothetical protein